MDRDYDGDMNFFRDQLTKAGITEEEFDISNYCGCTFNQLQSIVNQQIAFKKAREGK